MGKARAFRTPRNVDNRRACQDLGAPGGNWSWLRGRAKVSSLGVQVQSLDEPWLSLGREQGQLLRFIRDTHDQQRRDRIRESLRTARGRVGSPRAKVDMEAMVSLREHSLRETTSQFNIGASICHRISGAHKEVQRGSK